LIRLIHFYRQQLTAYNNPLNFFEDIPTIKFIPHKKVCPACGKKLTVLKTGRRIIHSIGIGTFYAYYKQLECKHHLELGPWHCEELSRILSPNSNYAYDVICEVGKLRFNKYRQVQEIQAVLQEKYNLPISESEIELLIYKFVLYLSVVHENSTELIKEDIQTRGGYILHIDCTCKGDSPKLASSIDEISGVVLHSTKLRTENTDEIVEFLTRIEHLFGRPLAVVSDMGKGIISAVKAVFGDIDHYICHFHFLKAIGKHLFKTEENLLYKQFSKMAISGQLKILKRELEKEFSTLSLGPIDQYIKTPSSLKQINKKQSTEMLGYCLILWVLDYAADGDGYCFPFDQSYLQFYLRVNNAIVFISEVSPHYPPSTNNHRILKKIVNILNEIANDSRIHQIVKAYTIKLSVFEKLRQALRVAPKGGNDGLTDLGITESDKELKTIRKAVSTFCEELKNQIEQTTDKDILKSYQKVQNQIKKYWGMLFSDPLKVEINGQERTIFVHRTNNILEQHFRRLNYGWRRIHGNSSVKKDLISIPEALPLTINLKNKAYIKLIFDDEFKIAQKFAEVNVSKIRDKLSKEKISKLFCSKKMKKVIRKPTFLTELKSAFSLVAT